MWGQQTPTRLQQKRQEAQWASCVQAMQKAIGWRCSTIYICVQQDVLPSVAEVNPVGTRVYVTK